MTRAPAGRGINSNGATVAEVPTVVAHDSAPQILPNHRLCNCLCYEKKQQLWATLPMVCPGQESNPDLRFRRPP